MNEMKGEKDKNMRNKGITLIALIVTIIVLLILAGVSIATLTGENGILTRANDAKVNTAIGEEKDAIALAYNGVMAENEGNGDVTANQLKQELDKNGRTDVKDVTGENPIKVEFNSGRIYEIDANGNIEEAKPPITFEQAKDNSMLENEENSTVTVPDGTVTVPAGFKVAEDSGSTLDEGIVIEDRNTNQFVWVPVSKASFDAQFVRRAGYYSGSIQSMTNYGEADSTGNNTNIKVTESETTKKEAQEMYQSVYDNEGFYIGRYEAGKDSNGNVVIQKGANVYNSVTWSKNKTMNEESVVEGAESNPDGAIELARNFDAANGYTTVTSTLCYGVQWDATLTWIDPDYTGFAKDSSGKGYYNASSPTTTGSSSDYEVNKIYDLAGNVYEWTMESFSTLNRVYRGGLYDGSGSGTPASSRVINSPSYSNSRVGFRVTLYL